MDLHLLIHSFPTLRSSDLKALSYGELCELFIAMPVRAHAPMGPLNCTVHVTDVTCEVWMGTQVQTRAQRTAAEAAGLPVERVTLHNYMLGGAFGRRLDTDLVDIAVRIGREVDGPVKVMWTREEIGRESCREGVCQSV